jgi:hypothetical protein
MSPTWLMLFVMVSLLEPLDSAIPATTWKT